MRDWLVSIRTERNQSQQAVADQMGIAQSTYASIESGARNPSVDMAKTIATTLNFEWTRFFEEGVKQ